MGYNQYIGARYVPKLEGEWNNTKQYEPLIIVTHEGNSFTSKKAVPIGIDILNTDYWVCTGNYNAQVELYRQETQNAVKTVNNKLDGFENTQNGKFQQLLTNYKTQINNYCDGKYSDINKDIEDINNSLTESENKIKSSMTKATEDLQNTVDGYTSTVNNQFQEIEQMLDSLDLTLDAGTSTDVEGENITIYDGGVY